MYQLLTADTLNLLSLELTDIRLRELDRAGTFLASTRGGGARSHGDLGSGGEATKPRDTREGERERKEMRSKREHGSGFCCRLDKKAVGRWSAGSSYASSLRGLWPLSSLLSGASIFAFSCALLLPRGLRSNASAKYVAVRALLLLASLLFLVGNLRRFSLAQN